MLMRIELVDLLRAREIRHPTRLDSMRSECDGGMSLRISGFPWWRDNPPHSSDTDITFYFGGIVEARLDSDLLWSDEFDEDLETFELRPLAECEWAKGANCEVYGNESLSNVPEIYASLHDYLISVGCPKSPDSFFNLGDAGSLSELARIASAKSYLLSRGPEAICRIVCQELESVGAKFNVVTGNSYSEGLLFVCLSGSYLICRSAYAMFEA